MSKISYIVLPKQDGRGGMTKTALKNRVIDNAMRLLVAVVLMCALFVIIILAAHMSVNNQPVQPWVLAPTPVLSRPKAEPRGLLDSKYILCKSELPLEDGGPIAVNISRRERDAIQGAVDVFRECVFVHVKLDINADKELHRSLFPGNWNETVSCRNTAGLPGKQPMSLGTILTGRSSVPVYDFNEEEIFYGTPFASKWQDLSNSGNDTLDRCVRLMLAWRFGGVLWNVDALRHSEVQPRFVKEVMDFMGQRVLVEKEQATTIYAELPCSAVIETLLTDFQILDGQLKSREHLKNSLKKALRSYPESLYLIPSGEVWDEQKRKGLLPNKFLPTAESIPELHAVASILPEPVTTPKSYGPIRAYD